MRRAGLLIAGAVLATGAGLAMASPASAAGSSGGGDPWDCDYGHSYYNPYHHYNRYHHWHKYYGNHYYGNHYNRYWY